MASIDILGKQVQIDFVSGPGATVAIDEGQLLAGARDMAALIQQKGPWRDEYADAFRAMNKIVFFEGKVIVNDYEMDRSCCDQDDAIFYWETTEFNYNPDADVHANTYFHDCWHVVQYRADGYPEGKAQEIDREVDAVSHQVLVAQQLGNSAEEIEHLKTFAGDPAAIEVRLQEGVKFGKFQPSHNAGAGLKS